MKQTLNTQKIEDYGRIASRVANVCILCNFLLCVVKLGGGIIANSSALVSDGVNSAFDVVSGIIVIIGVKLADKEADDDHPYGHERLESVAAIVLAVILFVTGLFIGYLALHSLITGEYKSQAIPGTLSIVAAAISIATKEILFWYTKSAADKINSVSLKAAAWDHRADVISTAGALIGIIFARFGYLAADQIASILVCIFIIRTSYVVFHGAICQMTDKSCDEEFLQELREYIQGMDGVLGVDTLQVRCFGNRYYVDLEIREDANKTLHQAHETAEKVHDAIEEKYPVIKHIMIHVNPEER